MFREGELLAGKYRLERLLGEGGMGYVVAATHEHLQQRVAVKFLAAGYAENSDAAARFLREARAAVRIQSEHIARVLDVGELDDGAPYMVMEFLSGCDLARELFTNGGLEVPTAVDYLLQACEAVAEAHSLGVIHRDLKPANLFLTRRPDGTPFVKVLDFGISKAITPESGGPGDSPSLTAAQALLGSPAYMSPEQARKPKSVDFRSDIWAFGVILYEFLAGNPPFLGDTPLSVLTAAVVEPTPSLRAVRPDVPPELEAVIEKCLEKKPQDRYQSVAELAQALAPFAPASSQQSVQRILGIFRSSLPPVEISTTLKSAGVEAVPHADTEAVSSSPKAPPAATPPTNTLMDWGKSEGGLRRSRRRAIVAVVGSLALAATGFVVLRSGTAPSEHPEVSAPERGAATRAAEAATVMTQPAAPPPTAPAAALPTASVTVLAPAVSGSAAAAEPAKTSQKSNSGKRWAPKTPEVIAAPPVAPEPDADPLEGRR
jgi:eukaryotic-like serine/threonine-protein kinase